MTPGPLSDCRDTAVVLHATPVEDGSLDALYIGAFGYKLPNPSGLGDLAARELAELGLECGGLSHRDALGVIYNLDEDVAR